jgi:hypothetical protein
MELNKPDTPIGFVILKRDNEDYYRVSQVGFEPVPISIRVISQYTEEIPYIAPIGSQLFVVKL